MGSSFIEYRNYGFWSSDELIEAVVGEVAERFRYSNEAWRAELSEHWGLMAKGGFGGWVHLKLDEFLTAEDRRLALREAVLATAQRHSPGDPVRETAEFLIELIDGRLKMDASHALHYMVQRLPGSAT